jgi:predicted nucleic acid-binding protein
VTKNSKRLVIDASIAMAAGRTMHPTSSACRAFLEEVRKICHRTVLTPALAKEWKKHQSGFAAEWIIEMRSRRKVVDVALPENQMVRDQQAVKARGKISKAVAKDLHLVEAALETDKAVVSLDEKARHDLLTEATAKITWVNCDVEGRRAIDWLRKGARPKKDWQLGSAIR